MKRRFYRVQSEKGFILVTAMMMLLILSLLGIFALNRTIVELKISGNDKVAKLTLYKADGGIQAGIELLEQNLSCPNGFSLADGKIAGIDILDEKLAHHYSPPLSVDKAMEEIRGYDVNNPAPLTDIPSDTIRAVRIPDDPANPVDTAPHTNLTAWGITGILPGSGMQMIAGYEGKGIGTAGAGSYIEYDLHSQHVGLVNSETKITIQWYHVIGQEGSCDY